MLREHRAKFEKLPIIGKISYTIYRSYPLTLQGTIVLLISTTSLKFFGYDSMDLVIFALAICAIVILIFCLFCVMIGGLIIQKKIRGKIEQEYGGEYSPFYIDWMEDLYSSKLSTEELIFSNPSLKSLQLVVPVPGIPR
mgnify:CR=1 FL=1